MASKSQAERAAAGKPPAGQIEVRAWRQSDSIWVAVEDDGRGLDDDALAAAAVACGQLARGGGAAGPPPIVSPWPWPRASPPPAGSARSPDVAWGSLSSRRACGRSAVR